METTFDALKDRIEEGGLEFYTFDSITPETELSDDVVWVGNRAAAAITNAYDHEISCAVRNNQLDDNGPDPQEKCFVEPEEKRHWVRMNQWNSGKRRNKR